MIRCQSQKSRLTPLSQIATGSETSLARGLWSIHGHSGNFDWEQYRGGALARDCRKWRSSVFGDETLIPSVIRTIARDNFNSMLIYRPDSRFPFRYFLHISALKNDVSRKEITFSLFAIALPSHFLFICLLFCIEERFRYFANYLLQIKQRLVTVNVSLNRTVSNFLNQTFLLCYSSVCALN